jgi:adenylate kinase
MTIICITGTPGVGKSKIAPLLSRRLRYRRLDLNAAIVREKLYTSYDVARKSWIVDMRLVTRYVKKITAGNWIIDSHLAHLLPPRLADIIIVLRCEPTKLERRLKRRNWPKGKITENVEAELISLIAAEARQRHRAVYDVDTTGKSARQIVVAIEKILKGSGQKYKKQIEWLK